jgi:hypothetical protein
MPEYPDGRDPQQKDPEDRSAPYKDCDSIEDPLRRGLCKACAQPVIGAAPFCKDHEPPVP